MAIGSIIIAVVLLVPMTYVVIKAVQSYRGFKRRAKLINKFPGVDPQSIFGHLREFPGPQEDGLRFMHEETKEYESEPTKFYFGPMPSVMVYHPNSVKALLKTSEPKPISFGAYRFAFPWLGDGLLIAGGKKWARNRRLLTPAFHFDILKPYMGINNRRTEVLLDKLDAIRGEYFEVFSHISLLTLDVMLRCAFSYDNDCQTKGKQHPYVKAVNELGESMIYRAIRPWLYIDAIFYYLTPRGWQFRKNCDYVHSVSEDIIHKRKQALKEHGDSILRHHKYIDFLDILLKAQDSDGQGLSDLDIRNEVDTFLFEGHDTTSSAISWTLESIAEYPEIQRKCQAEIDSVLEGRETDEIFWDDLTKFPYLTMCIKEGLRLHSPVPFIERQTTKDMDLDGYLLPEGSLVGINIYVLHHNTLVWDEPYEFRPERFSPENLEKMDPFAFVPFSAGPRNCIGQNFAMHEMKVIIARILRRFHLELDPERKPRHEMAVVMRTEDGMYMKATPRSHTGQGHSS